MNKRLLLILVLLAVNLASCGTPDVTQPPGESAADDSPVEWLVQAAFVAASQEIPVIIPSELPEGFVASDPVDETRSTLSGNYNYYEYSVVFERPVDGQVNTEDYIYVHLYAYDVWDGRNEHISLYSTVYQWEFAELDGQRIARFHSSGVDGRAWISGPYLVNINCSLDTSEVGPWVDTFASLFLAMFPPN